MGEDQKLTKRRVSVSRNEKKSGEIITWPCEAGHETKGRGGGDHKGGAGEWESIMPQSIGRKVGGKKKKIFHYTQVNYRKHPRHFLDSEPPL